MRTQLVRLAVFCLLATGCRLWPDSDFPASAVPMPLPPEFRVWWEALESCSGHRARFDDVRWFQTSELSIRGETAFGAWFPVGNRIALLGSGDFTGSIVRHEMLHAILQDGDHPSRFFESRCGDFVMCGRNCGLVAVPPEATPIPLSEFNVEVEPFPKDPSFGRHGGRMTFAVRIRNTSAMTGYARIRDYSLARCEIGIVVSSASDPDRFKTACATDGMSTLQRVFFAPGEIRTALVDVVLGSTDMGEPFVTEPLVAGAFLADNVRRTIPVVLQP